MQEKKDWLSGHNMRKTADLAKQYHENGFCISDPAEDVLALQHTPEGEARKVWYETGKHERYAIFAELIQQTMAAAEAHIPERLPFGLVKRAENVNLPEERFRPRYETVQTFHYGADLFEELRSYMTDTLVHAQEEVIGKLEDISRDDPQGKDRRLYDRYIQWLNLGNNAHDNNISPKATLTNGIKTATETMADILRIVPVVLGREKPEISPSSSVLTEIALHSYPVVTSLASFEVFNFAHAINYLLRAPSVRPIVAKHFSLEDNKRGNMRLYLADSTKGALEGIRKDIHSMSGPRLGCPALIDFGDGSAMQRLWYWHVSIGEGLYGYLYPAQTPKSL